MNFTLYEGIELIKTYYANNEFKFDEYSDPIRFIVESINAKPIKLTSINLVSEKVRKYNRKRVLVKKETSCLCVFVFCLCVVCKCISGSICI